MKITKNLLIEKGATCDGLDYFQDMFPDGVMKIEEWTEAHQAMLLGDEKARKYWGWLVGVNLIPTWSMREADLSGANLSGANLSEADLSEANLRWANLSGANHNKRTIWPEEYKNEMD